MLSSLNDHGYDITQFQVKLAAFCRTSASDSHDLNVLKMFSETFLKVFKVNKNVIL